MKMRIWLPLMLTVLIAGVVAGCSRRVETKSDADISKGDEKLSEVDEMQKVEALEGSDYNTMTQVDPNLKQEAMADYDKAIHDDPNNPEAYYARGFAQLSHGDAMFKAIDDFTKAIELKPGYARAYLMRGRAYAALGEMEKARADRAKAIELEPGIDD